MGLLGHDEDDDSTVIDVHTEKRPEADGNNSHQAGDLSVLGRLHFGVLLNTNRFLCRRRQVASSCQTVYECWTIVYCRPRGEQAGHVVSAAAQPHFGQQELADAVARAREQYEPLTLVSRDYDGNLERRLQRLDWAVQDELYGLVWDRTEKTSTCFRRREYKLVVLARVPGGDMTDGGWVSRRAAAAAAASSSLLSSSWWRWPASVLRCGRRLKDAKAASHVEVKRNDAGWGAYSRDTQPWRRADEGRLLDD